MNETLFTKDYDNTLFKEQNLKDNFKFVQHFLTSALELLEDNPTEIEKCYTQLDQIDRLLKTMLETKNFQYGYFLIKGSIYSSMIMMSFCLQCDDIESAFQDYYEAKSILMQFVQDVADTMENHFLEMDVSSNPVSRILVPKE